MSKRPEIEVLKRDNALFDIIFEHKGSENAISRKELVSELNKKGFSADVSNIHITIGQLMEKRRLPICSIFNGGYYYPKNRSDIQRAIDELIKKRDGLQEHIDFLKEFIIE